MLFICHLWWERPILSSTSLMRRIRSLEMAMDGLRNSENPVLPQFLVARLCRLPKEHRLIPLLRLSARVRVKRFGSSVLAVPSHASRGACCHCQYPQSRNDQRVPTRADGGSAILTESILFDEPTGRDISKASKVYRRRDSVRDGDAMIESPTRRPSVTSCRNRILRNRNNWE